MASWSYDPTCRAMVTYDTPANAAAKVGYIQERRLGGAMWWESSGDKQGDGSLINLVSGALSAAKVRFTSADTHVQVVQGLGGYEGRHMDHTPNVLEYPHSTYDNLKAGFPNE